MFQKLLLIISLLFGMHQIVKAQYGKLLRLTQDEVRQEVKGFPIVERDSLEHEMMPFLLFKKSKEEIELICYFFYDRKCHLVRHITSPSTFTDAVKVANESYHRVSNDQWISRDSTYTIHIDQFDKKVVTTYIRGV